MDTTVSIETQFLSMVNIVASKYGMEAEIDFKTYTINFTGGHGSENEVECAAEIANLFGEYLV